MSVSPPIQVVFSFDTTGSMIFCLHQVRDHLDSIIDKLYTEIPNIQIAIFAHGDYGDEYVYKFIDFKQQDDTEDLKSFLEDVTQTYGDDWPECYELVLHKVRVSFVVG